MEPTQTIVKHIDISDSNAHGANMGPIWGRQDPDGPHVGPMNLAIRDFNSGKAVTGEAL